MSLHNTILLQIDECQDNTMKTSKRSDPSPPHPPNQLIEKNPSFHSGSAGFNNKVIVFTKAAEDAYSVETNAMPLNSPPSDGSVSPGFVTPHC